MEALEKKGKGPKSMRGKNDSRLTSWSAVGGSNREQQQRARLETSGRARCWPGIRSGRGGEHSASPPIERSKFREFFLRVGFSRPMRFGRAWIIDRAL